MATEAKLIDAAVTDPAPHYEPYGWLHWPEHPWMSYQFRRALGETQEGGGAVGECFQAAARMAPGDRGSWHAEWLAVAERNRARGDAAEAAGRLRTARNCCAPAGHHRGCCVVLRCEGPGMPGSAAFRMIEALTRPFAALHHAGGAACVRTLIQAARNRLAGRSLEFSPTP